jgi:hypothetical protein
LSTSALKRFTFYCIFLTIGLSILNPGFAADRPMLHVDPACVNRAEGESLNSKQFEGKFSEFVWGDYLHAEFIDANNKNLSIFVDTRDASCFLALHKSERIKISFNTVCRYIDEGAGIYPAEEITQIETQKENLIMWREKFDFSKNQDTCDKLEQKYTRKP